LNADHVFQNKAILMKKQFFILSVILIFPFFAIAQSPAVTGGVPAEIVVTPNKTTMLADGKAKAVIVISLIDKQGNTVTAAANLIRFTVSGDAKIIGTGNVDGHTAEAKLKNGKLQVILQAGKTRGTVKFDASGDSLMTGSTEIHTVQPGIPHPVTTAPPIAGDAKITDKIIGADISFLPQLEDRGMKFYGPDGRQRDALEILKEHGFNYIRLRIFNDPKGPKGYSPKKGFCDLGHTLQMAKRIKAAGMKFLLDFHYSDTWADPQKQFTPAAWTGIGFDRLKDSVYTYTKNVMQALKDNGTAPDMVQVGNEINHGILWPEGAVNNLDSLANLLYAGIKAAKEVNPSTAIMLHIALGGQDEEARFFMDNMLKRQVPFDVIGLSYYPKWHGTLPDLKHTMADMVKRYHKYVMVAEYSQLKKEVSDIAFTVPGNKAPGTFIWEPLNTWEAVFDRNGKANAFLEMYPSIARKYNVH
jgi:hypothetical protein